MNLSDHAKEFDRLAVILRRVQAEQAASMNAPGLGTRVTLRIR